MNKLIYFSFLALLIANYSSGQDDQSKNWTVGLSIIPENLSQSFGSSFETNERPGVFGWESQASNLSYGLFVQRKIFSKFKIISGLTYANKDHNLLLEFETATEPLINETVKVRFLEIPIILRYNLFGKKARLHLEGGIVNSFLLSDEIEYLETSNFLFGYQFGLGCNFDIRDDFYVSVTPFYRYFVSEFFKDEDYRIESFGGIVSIGYHF